MTTSSAMIYYSVSRMMRLLATATAVCALSLHCFCAFAETDGWDQVPGILKNIAPPEFPDHKCIITDFGAQAGGPDGTAAIAAAIDDCAQKGGGYVVIPAGEFHTGAIHLKSNVDLHLE